MLSKALFSELVMILGFRCFLVMYRYIIRHRTNGISSGRGVCVCVCVCPHVRACVHACVQSFTTMDPKTFTIVKCFYSVTGQ